jgi:glycosyltransferase involved in cell wall biosynthesis
MNDTPPATPWELPAFERKEFRPKTARYALCIPVINEGEKMRRFLERLYPFSGLLDVIVADGGRTDGSLASVLLPGLGVRTLLIKTGPGKLSAQMRMGMGYAMEQGYEGVILIDGNNKDDPSALPTFIKALDEGYDHLQGSRFIPGGKAVNTPPGRWLGVRLLHAPIISLSSGFYYTDTTNGFRAYSRRFLLDKRVAPFRNIFVGYELHYYLAIQAVRRGYRVKELPVTRTYPLQGNTPSKIRGWRGNLNILVTLLRTCFGDYNLKG